MRGELQEIYAPMDEFGKERKPPLQPYPEIPWESINLDQFNIVPKAAAPLLKRFGGGWGTFRIIPVESGRGCPYGCEFCTVTGFFGDSIRFRTNESVVNELLKLKERARSERGQIAVFFIDDNFAINVKRTKSLLRDIIAANAQVHWVAQISANLLRDEELVDLIAAAGGKWIFIGMESIDPANLKDVNKGFNKPGEYAAVLERLAQRNVYAITSFIFGMDNDTTGSGRADARAGSHLAARAADFRPAHAAAGHSSLQTARGRRPAHTAQALAGIHPLRDGPYAAEDDHRGSSRGGEIRLGSVVQPGGDRPRGKFAQPQAAGLSHQHPDRAPLLPRNLFPAIRQTGVGENDPPKPQDYLEAHQGRLGEPSRRDSRQCRRGFKQPQRLGLTPGKSTLPRADSP